MYLLTSNNPFTDLPGVEVIGQTSITITDSSESFYWSGYGFKLEVPPDSLPSDVGRCTLHITVSLAGEYQLPNGQELVSAVFWVCPIPSLRFKRPLKMGIQHCAEKTDFTELTFVRAFCSQKSLPYVFEILKGRGSFPDQNSYATLDVYSFSGHAIAMKHGGEKRYIASFFNCRENPWTTEIYFVITWDSEPHITVSNARFRQP